jgi:hypothetical protein
MKTFVYLVFTCFISTGAFLAAPGSKYPLLLYAVGFVTWTWFIRGWSKRSKRDASRRNGEQLFQEYMRGQLKR